MKSHITLTKYFHPVAIKEHVQLEGGLGEGEVVVSPAHLHVSEEVSRQASQQFLQVVLDYL